MTSDYARQPDGAFGRRRPGRKRKGIRRRPWTRRNVLALTGSVTVIILLALFGIYEALPGRLPLGGAPAAATSTATTFYYSDGKTVLGTLSHTGRPDLAATGPWAPYLMTQAENELTQVDRVPQQELETGGLKIVTTISKPAEQEMYKAVDENVAAVKATPGAQFPSYIRIGAELQNPRGGEIIAEYPGPGQDMSAAECAKLDCYLNTAAYSREQVGSAFQPYVLAAAVADGMNITTSTLQASPYLCVPAETQPAVLSVVMKSLVTRCPQGATSRWRTTAARSSATRRRATAPRYRTRSPSPRAPRSQTSRTGSAR